MRRVGRLDERRLKTEAALPHLDVVTMSFASSAPLYYIVIRTPRREAPMPDTSILTVRLPAEEIERLDALAAQRRQTRSQLVQQTLRTLLASDDEQRQRQLEALRERLRPAIEAQDAFLDRASIADEHRPF